MAEATLQLRLWISGLATPYHISVARLHVPGDRAVFLKHMVRAFGGWFGRNNLFSLVRYTPWGAKSFLTEFVGGQSDGAVLMMLDSCRALMFQAASDYPGAQINRTRGANGFPLQHIASDGVDLREHIGGFQRCTFVIEFQ